MDPEYKNVGRNDPCPCGSGKKYKKCHYQKDQVRKQTEESTAQLSDFIKPDHNPYLWFKGLQVLNNRRDWPLLYEVFAESSPIRRKYQAASRFVEAARSSSSIAPAGGEFELRRFHLLGDHMFVMGARGLKSRMSETVEFEVISTIKTEEGYRITDVECLSVPKTDEQEDPEFAKFASYNSVLETVKQEPIERTPFVRWTLDGPPPEALEDGEAATDEPSAEDNESQDEVIADDTDQTATDKDEETVEGAEPAENVDER